MNDETKTPVEETKPPMTLQELVIEYCASNMSVQSKQTKLLYQLTIRRYEEFLGRPGTLADLTDKQVVAFVRSRIDTINEYEQTQSAKPKRPLSPYTIEREGNKVLALWRWAARQGWIEAPTVKIAKRCAKTPIAWSRDEMDRLIAAAGKYSSCVVGVPGSVYFTALILLMYDTGERVTPMQLLKWSDVDLLKRFVVFRADTRKGRGSQADNVQKLSTRTVKALEALRQESSDSEKGDPEARVFRHADRGMWYYHHKSILGIAGLPTDRGCQFHRIRRTHATHLYVAGGDPTQSLGHASDAMTRMYYLDPTQANKGYAADLLKDGWRRRIVKAVRKLRAAFGL